MANTYDFIVVGAGPAGSVLASRLAQTSSKPSVLLLEAGGSNDGLDHLSGIERFKIAFQENSPLNWGFKTVPQTQLSGQIVDYSRGKGLGGSTAINFCGWSIGASDDYDEWSRQVGDDAFAWANVRRALKKIERAHLEIPKGHEGSLAPKPEDHGLDGLVDVSYGETWLPVVKDVFAAAEHVGLGLNPDVNSGNPLGMGMGMSCIYKGFRVTSASAYLSSPPQNLTILPNSHVAKVLLEGTVAKGVQLVDGGGFFAKHEVIISCGTITTPQVLLLSGIGPAEELDRHSIPTLHNLPLVGKNLRDHPYSAVGVVIKKDTKEIGVQTPTPMGWFKSQAALDSVEFNTLPVFIQEYLQKPTVPSWELAGPILEMTAPQRKLESDEKSIEIRALVMNPQSRGTITLKSSDPLDDPIIDPRFLTHPYDRRVLVEGVRQSIKVFEAPSFREKTQNRTSWPADTSDEAIWQHIKGHLGCFWHMCGTVQMGNNPDEACVDSSFRVFGLQKLRVVDLSVAPLVPNCHTQSVAYIVGEIAADKLITEYQL